MDNNYEDYAIHKDTQGQLLIPTIRTIFTN